MTTTARIRTYGHFAVNIYDSHGLSVHMHVPL